MKPAKGWKLYFWLGLMNLYVSMFSFGGGYVVIPMLRKIYVEKRRLFSEEELMDMAAVAQSSPGAIAINLSALCGYKVAGGIGAAICCVGAVLPPIVLLAVISLFYDAFRANALISAIFKGMEGGVAAIMLDFVFDLCKGIFQQKVFFLSALTPLAFAASFFLHVHAGWILLAGVILGVVEGVIRRKRGLVHG